MWLVVDPVPLEPSPNAQAHTMTEPSGSLEPRPSKEHASAEHDVVNDGTGAWLSVPWSSPVASDRCTTGIAWLVFTSITVIGM